ncbi:MAG: hypothetical protein J1F64_06950, partial [Oscillospiraceae bacterium]|nr:hypothetical protein [Oscillospiraceae bacterium]
GGYHVYRNSYDKNIDDYKMTECDSYSVMNMINMTALPEEYTSVICKLSSFLCEEITILTLNDKEIDMAKEYFKSCICSTTIDEFNKNIDKINADLKDFRSIISEYDTYKKIKNNIDKGIGAIWSKEVFHEKDKGSRKKKKAKSRRKNR